jgi:hypothetical protein
MKPPTLSIILFCLLPFTPLSNATNGSREAHDVRYPRMERRFVGRGRRTHGGGFDFVRSEGEVEMEGRQVMGNEFDGVGLAGAFSPFSAFHSFRERG